jgi:hypothetical protein
MQCGKNSGFVAAILSLQRLRLAPKTIQTLLATLVAQQVGEAKYQLAISLYAEGQK